MRIFFVAVGLLVAMFVCLAFLFNAFINVDAECKKCEGQKQFYIEQLIQGNTRIKLADSVLKANGMLNPEDTTWQSK
jgi:hypothetical protein